MSASPDKTRYSGFVYTVCMCVCNRRDPFPCLSQNCHIIYSHACLVVFLTDKEVLELFANSVSTMGKDNRAIQKLERRRTE